MKYTVITTKGRVVTKFEADNDNKAIEIYKKQMGKLLYQLIPEDVASDVCINLCKGKQVIFTNGKVE